MSIGMGASWLLSSALNLYAMRKKAKISPKILLVLLPCTIAAVPSLFLTQWLYNLTYALPAFLRLLLSGGIGFIFIIALNFLFGILKLDFFVSEKKAKTTGLTPALKK